MRFFINFILLAAAIAMGFIWIRPEWLEISSLRKETLSYQETLNNLQAIQNLRDKFLNDYNSVSEADKQKLIKMLPSSVNEGEILVMLEDLIKSNGLSLKTVNFEKKSKSQTAIVLAEQKKPYQPSVLAMEFFGSYEAFKNFLKNLEKSLLVFEINEISFGVGQKTKEGKETGEPVFQFRIIAKTYWQE